MIPPPRTVEQLLTDGGFHHSELVGGFIRKHGLWTADNQYVGARYDAVFPIQGRLELDPKALQDPNIDAQVQYQMGVNIDQLIAPPEAVWIRTDQGDMRSHLTAVADALDRGMAVVVVPGPQVPKVRRWRTVPPPTTDSPPAAQ